MRRDFGHFLLPEAPGEEALVQEMILRAVANPTGRPVIFLRTFDGTSSTLGYTVQGRRMLSVDRSARELVVEEEWGGVVTARRTRRLGAV